MTWFKVTVVVMVMLCPFIGMLFVVAHLIFNLSDKSTTTKKEDTNFKE
jgi:hypothetical protein